MAFEFRARAGLGLLILGATACGGGLRPFVPRPPLARDTDLQSFKSPCREEPSKKDAHHIAGAPEVYVSPLAWDGIDNSIFRPLSRVFAVDPPGESVNPNSFDEVADSAWFTNRVGVHSMTMEELSRGACERATILQAEPADGEWLVDEGKANGSSPGFRVNIPGKGKYLFKADATPPELYDRARVFFATGPTRNRRHAGSCNGPVTRCFEANLMSRKKRSEKRDDTR